MSPWSPSLRPPWRPFRDFVVRGLLIGLATAGSQLVPLNILRAATPAGTTIVNQAAVSYAGSRETHLSNTDRFEVLAPTPPASRSDLGAYRLDRDGDTAGTWTPANYQDTTGQLRTLAVSPAASADQSAAAVRLSRTTQLHCGELILLRVVDHDQNRYVTESESVTVEVSSTAGERETLQLAETAPDSGVFAGCITISNAPTCTPHDGYISATPNSALTLHYADRSDASDTSDLQVLVDPYGLIFDSSSGTPLDGVRITLIDDATGQPAEVWGPDGQSRYPSSITTGETVRDAAGTVYSLASGAFSFPRVRPGRYRYQVDPGTQAGFTYPSTVGATQLAALPGAPYAITPASTGGTFEVVADLVRTDIPLDPQASTLVLTLSTPTTVAGTGDFVRYDLELTNRRKLLALRDLTIEVGLPAGLQLEAQSLTRDGTHDRAAQARDGRTFTLAVANLAADETTRFSYFVRVLATRPDRIVTTAIATAGALRSTPATAGLLVQDDLQANRAHLLGRVARWADGRANDEGLPGVAVLLETGAMVVTDARGFFHFAGLLPGTHVVQLDRTSLPPGAQVVLPEGSTEHAGRPWSRFVDLAPGSLWTADFYVETSAATSASSAPVAATAARPPYDQAWIDAESDTADWLEPNAATPLPTPAVTIVVKHRTAHTVRVLLNGHPVAPIKFDGTLRSRQREIAVSRWSGVMLQEGDNLLEIIREDSYRIERGRETRHIRYAAPPVRAELVEKSSHLVADGLSPPVVAVRLFDRHDQPARAGITGRFVVHPPFTARRVDAPDSRLTPGAAVPPTTFTVGEDGLALISLEPTTNSGTVRIDLELATGTQTVRADLAGHRDDWIVVGIAEGTTAWHTIDGHLENAAADDLAQGWDETGRLAFYAKGRIKGGWLLTAACDSAKDRALATERLHNLIDSDAYYTVYGDESQRLENAPSSRKYYVKLERDAVTALLGDFSLDWTSTQFTTYRRELHGAKIEYRGKPLRASAFQSEAGLTHGRDEFRGTGMSGPYALRQRPIVAFSEQIVVQERDRLRPDIVVSETALTRGVDYQIDPIGGIVTLSQPLFPSSAALNPQFLVVSYELADQTAGITQGARVEYTPTERVALGASHVRQEHDDRVDTTTGLDARITLAHHLAVTAEYAHSDNATGGADAYRTELVHQTDRGQARAYYREVGAGFGLDQLSEFQRGNQQFGVEGTQRLSATMTTRGLLYQETILATGDQRRAGEAQLEWARDEWTLRTGLRSSQDTQSATASTTTLFTSGLSRRFLHERLEIRADHEQSLGGTSENLDFPTRTVLGARYAVSKSTALIAEQEWDSARDLRAATSRVGLAVAPWTGATFNTSLGDTRGTVPSSTLGAGLNQTIPITPTLAIDGGLQRTQLLSGSAADIARSTPAAFSSSLSTTANGFATPTTENTAAFLGLHWRPGAVTYHLRVEHGEYQGTQRTSLLGSAQTEAGRSLGLLGSLTASQLTTATGNRLLLLNARSGVAWRPTDQGLTALQRLDLVHVPGGGAASSATGWKVIENLHLNQRIGRRLQFSAHLGAKYVLTGPELAGLTTLGALETRANLGPRWDIGLTAAALSGWGAGGQRWSTGLSVGRTVATNVWVGLGYNFRGFTDRDFTAARYTAPGVVVRFRLKFDQESLAGLIDAIKAE